MITEDRSSAWRGASSKSRILVAFGIAVGIGLTFGTAAADHVHAARMAGAGNGR